MDIGAITRLRAIRSAEALLRLILAHAWNDWSLRPTAAWARRIRLAVLSDVTVLKWLRHAPAWLGMFLVVSSPRPRERHPESDPLDGDPSALTWLFWLEAPSFQSAVRNDSGGGAPYSAAIYDVPGAGWHDRSFEKREPH